MSVRCQPPVEILSPDNEFLGYACMDCGRPVTDWGAEDALWAEVMGGGWDAGHICADCFILRAHSRDIYTSLVRSDGR